MQSIEDMATAVQDVFLGLFQESRICQIGFSGGKDSSAMVNLCLIAAKDAVLAGLNPKIIVITSSTGVENPEIDNHFREEMEKMKHFAEKHGFSLETVVVTPLLSSSWQLKVLSGRGLPSYAGDQASCSVDLKVNPQKAYRKKLAKQIASMTDIEPVICVGTRFDESAKRSARMIERDESATVPVRNKDGELVLSPIAQWSEDDVWEYLGMVGNGMLDGYSTFQEVDRIYAHSAGTRCSVVAQAMTAGIKRGGCGARTGCFVCLQAEDKSLASMINLIRGIRMLSRWSNSISFYEQSAMTGAGGTGWVAQYKLAIWRYSQIPFTLPH